MIIFFQDDREFWHLMRKRGFTPDMHKSSYSRAYVNYVPSLPSIKSTFLYEGPLGVFFTDVVTHMEETRFESGAFNSHHEAYALLLEGLEQYWSAIKHPNSPENRQTLYRALVQLVTTAALSATELV